MVLLLRKDMDDRVRRGGVDTDDNGNNKETFFMYSCAYYYIVSRFKGNARENESFYEMYGI